MLRHAVRSCPFCEVRAFLARPAPAFQAQIRQSQSQSQSRLYSQIEGARSTRYAPSSTSPSRSHSQSHSHSHSRSRSRSTPFKGRDRPRPSRMVLSDTVARPPRPSADGKPLRKKREPFSHLNRTRAPSFLARERDQGPRRFNNALDRKQDSGRPDGRQEARFDGKRRSRPEPFHALKMQRSLHEVPYGSRAAIKRKIEQIDSFESLPLLESVQDAIKDALPNLEYRNPTPAQALTIPALLGSDGKQRTAGKPALKSFLLAAETGSGKTLAYLLPTIDAIKREEMQETAEAEERAIQEAKEISAKEKDQRTDIFAVEEPQLTKAVDPARPRAIVLVPSAELVAQVGAVAKSLSHSVKIRAAPISAKTTSTVIRSRLFNENGVDLVITTPFLLGSIAKTSPNILARVTHLIVDEADSLLDRSFKTSTVDIVEKTSPSLKKLVLCSATIPRHLDKYLANKYPDMKRLVTPNLHAIPRRVQLGVVDVNKDPYRGNKDLACADTIWQIGKSSGEYDSSEGKEAVPTKRILVFVNLREQTEEVAEYLRDKGIDAQAFHRDTDPSRQGKILASFTGTEKRKEGQEEGSSKTPPQTEGRKRQLTNTKVIVTTDLGSRGIDTVSVRHVILYDVPHTTIDFIHRLGRTGRMGRRGRGIVLLGRGDRADVVKEVRDAMFRGEALI